MYSHYGVTLDHAPIAIPQPNPEGSVFPWRVSILVGGEWRLYSAAVSFDMAVQLIHNHAHIGLLLSVF